MLTWLKFWTVNLMAKPLQTLWWQLSLEIHSFKYFVKWNIPIEILRILHQIQAYYMSPIKNMEWTNHVQRRISSYASVITERTENNHKCAHWTVSLRAWMIKVCNYIILCKSKATDAVFTCNKMSDHHLYDLVIICSCNAII